MSNSISKHNSIWLIMPWLLTEIHLHKWLHNHFVTLSSELFNALKHNLQIMRYFAFAIAYPLKDWNLVSFCCIKRNALSTFPKRNIVHCCLIVCILICILIYIYVTWYSMYWHVITFRENIYLTCGKMREQHVSKLRVYHVLYKTWCSVWIFMHHYSMLLICIIVNWSFA